MESRLINKRWYRHCAPERVGLKRKGRRSTLGRDGNDPATTLLTELDSAVGQGKQCVVATATNVLAWMEVGTALTDDDLTGGDDLAAVPLDTKVLR
jgi:hypothetical protein